MTDTQDLTHADGVQLCATIARHEGFEQGWPEPCQKWGRGERADHLGLCLRSHDPGWANLHTGEAIRVYAGDCLVLEFKRSRSDFQRDGKKAWRAMDKLALGSFRAFVYPQGLIEAHEIPDDTGWGAYELLPGGTFHCVKPPQRQRNVDWRGTLALVGMLMQRQAYTPTKAAKGQTKQLSDKVFARVNEYLIAMPDSCARDILQADPDLPFKRAEALRRAVVDDGRFPYRVDMGVTRFQPAEQIKFPTKGAA